MANSDGSIIIDTKLDNSGFQSGSKKMEAAINGLQSSIDSFGKQAQASVNSVAPALQNAANEADALSNALSESQFQRATAQMAKSCDALDQKIASLKQRAEQGFSSESQAQKWQADFQKVTQEANTLQSKLNDLGSQTVKANSLSEMEAEAQKLEQKLFSLYEKRDTMKDLGADQASAKWKALEDQITKTEQALDRVERGIAAKKDPTSAESEANGAGYTRAESMEGFQQLASSIQQSSAALSQLSGSTAQYDQETNKADGDTNKFMATLGAIAGGAAKGAWSVIKGFASAVQAAGRAALTAAAQMARLPFKAIGSAANMAKKAMSAFHSNTKKSSSSTNGLIKGLTSLKRLLITRVKRMFISAIFNQIRASLQNLAKYSDAFNQSMSNIKNSAKTMSGNLAVAFGNLVNAVAPALQTVISWLSQAISYLNAFFALLQGKSTVTVAKKATDDYAKSLKNASGAAKDLNHQVYGFDELTKQESNNGGGGSNAGAEYEEKEIGSLLPDSIKQMFEGIKQAIAAQEWEQVGGYIANGLNNIVTTVDDWINTTLRPFGVTWAGNIARILNGLVDKVDFGNLGNLFADGLNTLVEIGYTFFSTFDWARLGDQLAAGVNNIFNRIDWEMLGQWFAAKLNALLITVNHFLSNLDWAKIGESVGTGVNSWFTSVSWDDLTDGVINGVNGIITAVQRLLKTVDWATIRKTFIDGINSLVHNIDWAGLILTLAAGFFNLVATFWSIVGGIDWSSLAKSFANGVNKVFSDEDNESFSWTDLTDGITKSINGIVTAIRTFLEEVDWATIANTFSGGVNRLIDDIDWGNLMYTLVLGLFRLVNTLFATISNINWKKLGEKVADGMHKIFGKDEEGNAYINWAELGKNFGESVKGVIDGIDSFVTNTDWAEVGRAIGDALGNIDWVGIATKLIGLLWDALWGAVELVGGMTQRLIELIFGTNEEVVIPDVFSEDVENQLKEQAGEAGRKAAQYLYCEFTDSTWYGQEDAQKAVIASAAMIGTGYQDEMCKWLKDGDWDTEMAALYSQKANALFGSITLENATVNSVKAAFASAGIEVTDGFAESILGSGAENIGAALTLLGAGVDQDTIAALDSAKLHENLMAYMNETGKDLKTVAEELATNTGDALGRLMPQGMEQGLKAGEASLQAEVDHIEDIASTADSHADITKQAKTTGSDADAELSAGLSENKDEVASATADVAQEIKDPLEQLPDDVKPYAETLMGAITEAIINGDPVAVAAIEAAANAIVDKAAEILSSTKGEEITTAFLNGMNNGIIYTYSPIVTNMGEIGSQVTDKAQVYINEQNGQAIGENMIIGMINGFNRYGQMLVNTIAHICSVCVEDARRILGIASPSKVFAEIGSYVMEGMQIGLEDSGDDAIRAVGDIAQSMIEEAENGNGMYIAIDAMNDGLDATAEKATRIADIFIGIQETISEMGGLPVPAVGNGQVVPFSAIPRNNSADDEATRAAGLEDALFNAISRARETDDGEPVVIKLYVDGREMSDVVTKYQRQQSRAMG